MNPLVFPRSLTVGLAPAEVMFGKACGGGNFPSFSGDNAAAL